MPEETPADASGESLSRKPQKKMTDTDKERLREMLRREDIRVDGKIHVPTVCRLTGLSAGCVRAFMKRDHFWAAQTSEARPDAHIPAEVDLIDRAPPEGILLTDAQFQEYQAMIRQQKKLLAKDWQALGMTPEAGERMEHYGTIGAAPMGGVLRVMTGQLISNLELLDRVIKGDCERVLTGQLPEEIDKKGEPRDKQEVERDWRYMVFAGMELQLKMFAHAHKTQAMVARVMADLRKMNGGAAPDGKGKFGGFEVSERSA